MKNYTEKVKPTFTDEWGDIADIEQKESKESFLQKLLRLVKQKKIIAIPRIPWDELEK